LIRIKAPARGPASISNGRSSNGSKVMPTGDMLFMAAFIIAFGVFAIVLGWADRRTRNLNR